MNLPSYCPGPLRSPSEALDNAQLCTGVQQGCRATPFLDKGVGWRGPGTGHMAHQHPKLLRVLLAAQAAALVPRGTSLNAH